MSGPSNYGKGDRARPVDQEKWGAEWTRIFRYSKWQNGAMRSDLLAKIQQAFKGTTFKPEKSYGK